MKIFKIIIFNIFIFLLIFLTAELLSFGSYRLKNRDKLKRLDDAGITQTVRYTKAHRFNCEDKYYSDLFSDNVNTNSKKRPILLLGCSYVYGTGLDDTQTLAYKIHKLTRRSVYKRGFPAGGPQLALDMFDTGVMKKQVPDAEYIIYVYLNYHLARLYAYQLDYIEAEVNQRYKLKNGKLIKIKQPKHPFYYSSFLVKNIQHFIADRLSLKEYDNYQLLNAVLTELMNQAKKNYKDVKFVILLYPSADIMSDGRKELMDSFEIKKLQEMGFIVLNAEQLTKEPIRNIEYRILDREHPNEKAWDTIAPALVKKLHL